MRTSETSETSDTVYYLGIAIVVGYFSLFLFILLRTWGCAARTFLQGSRIIPGDLRFPEWTRNVFFHYEKNGVVYFTTPVRVGIAFTYAIGEAVVGLITSALFPVWMLFGALYLVDRVFHYMAVFQKKRNEKKAKTYFDTTDTTSLFILIGMMPETFEEELRDFGVIADSELVARIKKKLSEISAEDREVLKKNKFNQKYASLLNKLKNA